MPAVGSGYGSCLPEQPPGPRCAGCGERPACRPHCWGAPRPRVVFGREGGRRPAAVPTPRASGANPCPPALTRRLSGALPLPAPFVCSRAGAAGAQRGALRDGRCRAEPRCRAAPPARPLPVRARGLSGRGRRWSLAAPRCCG